MWLRSQSYFSKQVVEETLLGLQEIQKVSQVALVLTKPCISRLFSNYKVNSDDNDSVNIRRVRYLNDRRKKHLTRASRYTNIAKFLIHPDILTRYWKLTLW